MYTLDFLSWLFYAAEEDGTLPAMLGTLLEAGLAVIVAVTVHRLTDIRDLLRRVDRLEDSHAHGLVAFDMLEKRVTDLEDEVE